MNSAEKVRWSTLTRRIVIARAGGLCELTGAPGHDVHHIFHRMNHPQVALDPRYCLLLNHNIHRLDDTGDLVNYIRDHMGEDRYYALKREAEERHSEPLDAIRFRLRQQLEDMTHGALK